METNFQDLNTTFHNLNIPPKIVHILDGLGFKHPSFIQAKTIPVAVEGKDIVGIAQTGTGKTLAFGVPMLARLSQTQGRGLILAPTRELAVQIHDALKKLAGPLGIHLTCLIGGEDMRKQIRELRTNVRVIIATPGRMLDHLRQNTTRLDDAIIVVLDEADRMLDMGFIPQVETILKYTAPAQHRQTLLFSATMPDAVAKIAHSYMKHPIRLEVAAPATTSKNIDQSVYIVQQANKFALLEKLLEQHKGSALIFTRTKLGASRLSRNLKAKNYKTSEIHSDKNQSQRQNALEAFKKGYSRIMVATEIAARGIDVKDIALVVNYDLPDDPDNYVHRIGRTGRAGKKGIAISFACPDQADVLRMIEKSINEKVLILEHPEMPMEYFIAGKGSSQGGRRRSGHGRPSHGRPSHGRPSHGRPSTSSHHKRSEGGHSSSHSGQRSSEGRSSSGGHGRSRSSEGRPHSGSTGRGNFRPRGRR